MSDEGTSRVLTFLLGGELFALDIRAVREIVQAGPTTPVPLMPGFVRGVMNLRGAVLPVIDLHARIGRAASCVGARTCIVILDTVSGGERVAIGLMVDAVSEVLEIADEHIESAPSFGASVRRDFVRGIGRIADRFVILLEPDRVFDVDDMARLCDASQAVDPA